MTVRRLVAGGAVAATLVLGAACTSSGDQAATTTTTITKEAYVARANVICVAYRKVSDASPPEDDAFNASYWNTQYTAAKQEVAKLRALPAPPGDASTVGGLYAQGDQAVAALRRIAEAAKAGDDQQTTARIGEVNDPNGPLKAFEAGLRAYGLTACA